MEQKSCPYCGFLIYDTFYFCPNCGKKLKNTQLSTSLGKQIGIYALSIFLPPLGIIPGFRYLFQKDNKAKAVGVIAILLTIISTFITVQLTISLLTSPFDSYITGQLRELQNLGY